MSHAEAGSPIDSDDLWYVQLASGEVRKWSLDQLDAAFQADVISERTHVLRDGTTQWVKLGELLGLDSSIAERATPASMPLEEEPISVGLRSIRPVVADIEDDVDPSAFRPRKRGPLVAAVAGAFVLCAIGVGVTRFGGSPRSMPAFTAAAAPYASPPPPATAGAAIPSPVVVDALPATTASADVRLTEEQRKALLDNDKHRDVVRKSRTRTPARGASTSSGKSVFHKGGNEFDPLNSAL